MSAPNENEPTVYVVTDLGQPAAEPSSRDALWALLRPLLGLALVAVPILATTGLILGLLLGWHPVILMVAAVLALPMLVNLLDLAGAFLGWPPLSWTSTQIIKQGRRKGKSDV